jgi:hypothetical protein
VCWINPEFGHCSLFPSLRGLRTYQHPIVCSALGTRSSVPRADIGESIPYSFDSGFSPHTFQASWPGPVLNTPELLITFNCPIDEISRNFHWFQEFENLRIWFSAFVKGNYSHTVFLETPLYVNTKRDVSKLPYLKNLWQGYVYVPPSLTFNNSTICPHSVFMCFVWIWEQTDHDVIPYKTLVCITQTLCVLCAVRSESLKHASLGQTRALETVKKRRRNRWAMLMLKSVLFSRRPVGIGHVSVPKYLFIMCQI